MRSFRLRHWLVVLTLALAAHAALLLRLPFDHTPAAAGRSGTGVRIALAPEQSPPQPKQVAASDKSAEQPKKKPEPRPEETPPKPAPEPQPVDEPAPKPQPHPEPQPTPVPAPKPAPKPEPPPKPRPAPKPAQHSEPRPQTTIRQRNPQVTPAGGDEADNAPARQPQKAARTQQGPVGSVADTPPDYRNKLRAWLVKNKEYPHRARRLRQEGTAVLYFVMDRNGHVLEWEIRKSSGHPLLDKAVENMIKHADPLPALPDSVSAQRLALTVPVSFQLR